MKQLRTVHTQTHTNIWQLLCQLLTHGLSVCLGTRPENTHTLYTVNCCSMGSNRKATGFSRKKHESLTQREWIDCLTENFKGGGGSEDRGLRTEKWQNREKKRERLPSVKNISWFDSKNWCIYTASQWTSHRSEHLHQFSRSTSFSSSMTKHCRHPGVRRWKVRGSRQKFCSLEKTLGEKIQCEVWSWKDRLWLEALRVMMQKVWTLGWLLAALRLLGYCLITNCN